MCGKVGKCLGDTLPSLHFTPRTGILSEPVGDPPEDNFGVDPLEEFPSWYPPVWRLDPERDFSLVDVPAGTPAYRSVQSFFYESLPETTVDVVGIRQVQNLLHWDKYQRSACRFWLKMRKVMF